MRDPAIVIQARVAGALMLRDVKTRFGGNPMNYIIAIAWPLAHMALLLTIYTVMGRNAPYGESALQFFATGVLPYLIFNYPARFVMMSVNTNLPLLGFPIVTLLDLIVARVILEMISALAVIIVVAAVLAFMNVTIMPSDPVQAVFAILATLGLAAGMGMLNALISKRIPSWNIVFIFISICLYLCSGIIFVPDALPALYRDAVAWNPLLQAVTWFRSAYYEDYGRLHLDRQYLVIWGLILILFSLALERFGRRWFLTS